MTKGRAVLAEKEVAQQKPLKFCCGQETFSEG
jgi:hypothetical protein